MEKYSINILRGLPGEQYTETFSIPSTCEKVLDALQWIYENEDNSLAFKFDCSLKNCGLCGVSVDGVGKMACVTDLADNMSIGPLPSLPLVKDLVIDRSFLVSLEKDLELFIVPAESSDNLPETQEEVSESYLDLGKCNECLVCASLCPVGSNESKIFGPFVWVRLAQLHLDKRDSRDRQAQATALGVNGCGGCGKCRCAAGIDFGQAMKILKGGK